jgi:hypothetical protein
MNSYDGKPIHVTKEQYAAQVRPDANCILVAVRGQYYYAEKFGKFIPIKKEEYERILDCPYRRYFTTALKKHIQWIAADGKGTTASLAELLACNRPNAMRFATAKRARQIAALLARPYRWIRHTCHVLISWSSTSVRHWADANRVADAIAPAPFTRAQQAWMALDSWVDRWMESNPVLRLTRRYIAVCQNVRTWPEVHCIGLAVLSIVVTVDCWCGGLVSHAFSVVPQPILFGVGLLLIALTAANLMVTAVLVIAFVLVLPTLLWRSWELRGGFVVRHLLPHGLTWRLRAWCLRRLHQRRSEDVQDKQDEEEVDDDE